jgi:hypothetical protein
MKIKNECVLNGALGFVGAVLVALIMTIVVYAIYDQGYRHGQAAAYCEMKIADKLLCNMEGYKYGN